jgi:hypothetical protein
METTSTSALSPGNYMRTSCVEKFLQPRSEWHFFPLLDLPTHTGEFSTYYNTADLQRVLKPEVFQELECEAITHMIL